MFLTRGDLILLVLCYLISTIATAEEKKDKSEKRSETQDCGRSKATATQTGSNIGLFQAREAQKGAWPWMAEVYVTRGNKKQPICGGALVSRFYVLTAAHCLERRGKPISASDVSVRLGEHDLESDKDGMKPVDVNVTSIHIHKDFDPVTNKNDISLLRLQQPANFSSYIQPLCLPDDTVIDDDLASRTGYVAGWGTTSADNSISYVLMEMSAVITDDETCRDAYEYKMSITDVNMCTVGVNGSSPCQGFGGSPLMLPGEDNRYYAVGIVSFGVGCGNTNYPDVYTRVTEYLDWMKEHMTDSSAGEFS